MTRAILFHAPGEPGKTLCGKPTTLGSGRRIAAPGGFVSCATCARAVRVHKDEAAPLRGEVSTMLSAGRRAGDAS
jgi:hypothetical protein